jgi:hypothetical protein
MFDVTRLPTDTTVVPAHAGYNLLLFSFPPDIRKPSIQALVDATRAYPIVAWHIPRPGVCEPVTPFGIGDDTVVLRVITFGGRIIELGSDGRTWKSLDQLQMDLSRQWHTLKPPTVSQPQPPLMPGQPIAMVTARSMWGD